MSNARVNNLELTAARIDGKQVIEIASKGVDGLVARWRPSEYEYSGQLLPVFKTDFNTRSNGTLADGYDFIHHTITAQNNRVVNGEVHGPTTSYAMDIINHRLSGYSTYIRAKIKTPTTVTEGNTRLQIRGGNRPASSGAGYQWISSGIRMGTGANAGRPILYSIIFRQGWVPNPAVDYLANIYVAQLNEYLENDEILILQQGRSVWFYYNGVRMASKILSDDQWTPGYFASIILDAGHIIDNLEVGHWDYSDWNQLGDEFSVPDLTKLWNRNTKAAQVVNGVVQSDPITATANGTHYSYGFSKEPIHDQDQIIRAVIREPIGVTMGSGVGVMVIGRANGGAPFGQSPQVGFLVTPSNGAQIVTILSETVTSRASVTSALAGMPPSWPVEIELQCIGSRYYGLINGHPVVEWIDSTGIVPVNADHRYYGWATAVLRNNSTYTYSPAIDSIKGLTHSAMPSHKAPNMMAISPTTLPLDGGVVSIIGEGLFNLDSLTVGRSEAVRQTPVFSDNSNRFIFPPKESGSYDVVWDSPEGTSSLLAAIKYAAFKRIFIDFSGVPDGPMPSDWAVRLFVGQATAIASIVSEQVTSIVPTTSNTNSQSITCHLQPVETDDQIIRGTTRTTLDGLLSGVALRLDSGMMNGVMGLITTGGDRGIWSIIDGTTVKRASFTSSHAIGDVWALKAEGKLYTLMRNPNFDGSGGTVVATWEDTTGLIKTGPNYRHGGFVVSSDRNFFGQTNQSADMDDFDFRDLAWTP